MTDTTSIRCPKCGEFFEPTEAFRHQMSEEILLAEKKRHEEEVVRVKAETEKSITERLATEAKSRMESLQKDAEEEKERNKRLLKQLEQLSEDLRVLRRKDEERELEMKKKLADEEAKIREEARKKVQEEHELKDREKDQNYSVALKQIEELKTKLQQGSQQAQGESLELALEEELTREFPMDVIEEVKKGQRGADILQRVVDKKGRECGLILWESKNAKWSDTWAPKLREDQRQAKAHLSILVVTDPPKGVDTYTHDNGIWICVQKFAVPLAMTLRYGLIRENFIRDMQEGKNEKKEELYRYITSIEFTHRMNAIIEAFGSMQDEVEREKRWFQTKWARQEKQLRKVIDHTQGMHGDLQGVVGKSLPELKVQQPDAGDGELALLPDEQVNV